MGVGRRFPPPYIPACRETTYIYNWLIQVEHDGRALMSDEQDTQLMSVRGMGLARVFQEPPETFSDDEAASAWAAIDLLEKAVKERKEQLRMSLLGRAQEKGTVNEKGSSEAEFGDIKVVREKRQAKLPDPKVVEEALKEAGLEYEDGFTGEMKWVLDPSKVEFLVKGGKIDAEKVEASKRVTYALKMKPNKEMKSQLEVARKKLLGE